MASKSKSQQRFMGMVHSYKEGTLDTSDMDPIFVDKIKRVAQSIKKEDAKDLAETGHKGLPEKTATLYTRTTRKTTPKERVLSGVASSGIPSAT